ncbi:MAG: UDP-N-acetylglucosamine 2-epimerase (non-hydrolyzing) [Bacteroidota bacterium]
MNKFQILFILGTRPEAIKLAPLICKCKNDNFFDVKVCITAQHREMLDQVLNLFDIIPDIDLDIMKSNQGLAHITATILKGLENVFEKLNPELVFVHGDTSTALAASLSAFYNKIPVAHVEAGLRTYNVLSPFPEEMNRQLTAKIAKFHFAPTESARQNLISEKVNSSDIFVTGNTVVDSLLETRFKIKQNDIIVSLIKASNPCFDSFVDNKFILITGHRRENFGSGLSEICNSVKQLANKYKNYNFVYPLHMNPNVRDSVMSVLSNIDNVKLIEHLDYYSFIYLMEKCTFILTDSGGIQEEAPTFGKPVLVMRDATERKEGVEAGCTKIVGTNSSEIVKVASLLIENEVVYNAMSSISNPYGDGKASYRIVSIIKNYYKNRIK